MKRISIKSKARRVCFRKWSNKSYSIFNTLSVLVKISVLSVSYNFLVAPAVAVAQPDTITIFKNVEIDEVVISTAQAASIYSEMMRAVAVIRRNEIEHQPINNLHGLLKSISSVDLRQRGGHGVQADLTIRGGSFDQVLILLNGINITDPQTGHHNLNIPIDIESIEKIEILQGPGSRVYGPGSFSGAINIITTPSVDGKTQVIASVGEHGLIKSGASAGVKQKEHRFYFSASSAKSDGYISNTDFAIFNFFTHAYFNILKGRLSIQSGYQDKSFGAQSFYSPKFPEQFEHTKTIISSATYSKVIKSITISPSVYVRNHTDRFELFRRQRPTWYTGHNYHNTTSAGAKIDATATSKAGRTRIGLEFRNENILSNVLGGTLKKPIPIRETVDTTYTKGDNRGLLNAFSDHTVYFKRMVFSSGAHMAYSSKYGYNWSFGLDASFIINRYSKLFISAGNTLRYPTFTDLYYNGPTNKGNINLLPEKANTVEIGLKSSGSIFVAQLSLFHRKATDVIDWIQKPENEIWETMNHTKINSTGFEAYGKLYNISGFRLLNELSINYNYLTSDKNSNGFNSFYALDYLKHRVTFSANLKVYRNIGVTWSGYWQSREGTYTEYPSGIELGYNDVTIVNLRIHSVFKSITVYLDCNNLINTKYVEIGNIEQPGRWLSLGFRYLMK